MTTTQPPSSAHHTSTSTAPQRPLPISSLFDNLDDRLLFAIPKKGRLHEPVLKLLEGADVHFVRKNRLDIALSTNLPVALVFLPAADIPKYVAEGSIDLGITGQDVIREAGVHVEELLELGFGVCRLAVQVPVASPYRTPEDLIGKRIVTSFEAITTAYFDQLASAQSLEGTSSIPVKTAVSYVSGSVEAACALGLADGIVDLVESGETMRAAHLHAISIILTSQTVLIKNPHSTHDMIETLQRRILGHITAQKYVYCNYNVPRSLLPAAVEITPGRKAPTIAPLESQNYTDLSAGNTPSPAITENAVDALDWVSVGVMVAEKEIGEKMDALERLGAKDILVFGIQKCRV